MTEQPIRYGSLLAILVAGVAAVALTAGVATWIGMGVLASRSANMKPPVANCASTSIEPHYEVAR